MKSQIVKRSIIVAGHKTSVSLEDELWKGLKDVAGWRDVPLSKLVSNIDSSRQHGNLSSAIRIFVLTFYRDMLPALKEAHDATHFHQARSVSEPLRLR